MRTIYSDRTFKVLIGTGVVLALLLVVAAYRAILAGCPDVSDRGILACLFLPTRTDLGIHLLSYAFMGMILLGTSSWLILLRRQWANMSSLIRNMALLQTPDNEIEQLTRHLGLQDKVYLLDSEAPLCFCAGFFSPHIYLSRETMEKLTPEQLEALLLHEKYHLEHYHPLKILLGRLIVSALFFIPVSKDLFKRYLIEKEIAADQSAIDCQGHRRGIAGALGKLVPEHATSPVAGFIVGGTDALSYRIDHVIGHTPQLGLHIPISHLVISFLITALTIAAILAPLSGSHP